MYQRKARRVEIGEPIRIRVAFSEAACHFNIAGEEKICMIVNGNQAKVADEETGFFKGLFTPGELGFYKDDIGFYCYPSGF